MSRAKILHPPLPCREGLGPTKIILGKHHVPLAHALALHCGLPLAQMQTQCRNADVVTASGVILTEDYPIDRITVVFVYRAPLPEVPVPYDISVLYSDERIIVIDKPHFLATIPRGMHITETALIKMRRLLNNDQLVPAHRLDRLTAGVLLFTTEQRWRNPYQQLFSTRQITKIYRALAPLPPPNMEFPQKIMSRIEKTPGIMKAREIPGTPNAETTIHYLNQHDSGLGEYELHPITGKTHQLRIHMNSIGLPIHGDPLYPTDLLNDSTDFSTPLCLRAQSLQFIDPITQENRKISSQQHWLVPEKITY